MSNIVPSQLKYGDYYIVDPDTGHIGNGQRDPTQALDIYKSTGVIYGLIESGNNDAGLRLKNNVTEWISYVLATSGQFLIRDLTNSKSIFRIEPDSNADSIRINAAGRIDIGGAFAIGSGGRLSVTTGTYNSLDVADTGQLIIDGTTGNITLNGVANLIGGQLLSFFGVAAGNTITIVHASGSGTVSFRNAGSANKTFSGFNAGFIMGSGSLGYVNFSA
jgi:hypothetical protein